MKKTLRRVLGLCLALVTVLMAVPLGAWAAPVSFSGGVGTEGDPFLIETKEQLDLVRNDLGAHYRLIAPIEFTEEDFAAGGKFYNGGKGFLPIGNDSSPFTGGFDGNGFAIKNLFLRVEGAAQGTRIGLFGYTSMATISNLMVENARIYANVQGSFAVVGGLVGYLYRSTVEDCSFSGEVWGSVGENKSNSVTNPTSASVGGLFGYAGDSTVVRCHNKGRVWATAGNPNQYANTYVGGLVGRNADSGNYQWPGSFSYCYNTGCISSAGFSAKNNGFAGGLAGLAESTYSFCYNTGSVLSSASICASGGLAGNTEYGVIFSNCFNSGSISAKAFSGSAVSAMAGGLIGRDYYSKHVNCYNSASVLARGFDELEGGFVTGSEGGLFGQSQNSGTVFTHCYYADSSQKGVGNGTDGGTKCTLAQMQEKSCFEGFDLVSVWNVHSDVNGGLPTLEGMAFSRPLAGDGVFAGGSGVESDPFRIATKEQLDAMRDYPAAYFCLENDIVFTEADYLAGGAFAHGGEGWTPIGDAMRPFTGGLDGKGFAVKNLRIRREGDGSESLNVGLFGYGAGLHLKNLTLEGAEIFADNAEGKAYVGGLAGTLYVSALENCSVSGGRIRADSFTAYVGGLAGTTQTLSNGRGYGALFSGCENQASIDCQAVEAYVGGIFGHTYEGLAQNCTNRGDLTVVGDRVMSNTQGMSKHMVGGIAGDACGAFHACSNHGTVSATNRGGYSSENAGGIVGTLTHSSVTECYNTGAVFAGFSHIAYAGGLVGYGQNGVTIRECYSLGDVTTEDVGYGANAGGLAGSLSSSAIEDCFQAGSITAKGDYQYYCSDSLGGLVGVGSSLSVSRCYHAGEIVYPQEVELLYVGALVGRAYSLTMSEGYYLDAVLEGVGEGSDAGVCYTAEQMQKKESFAGFDFEAVWTMEGNEEYLYPELKKLPMIFEKKVSSLVITETPRKYHYLPGEPLDPTGLQITAFYDNGTSELISDYTLSGFASTPGYHVITVSYGGAEASFRVEVHGYQWKWEGEKHWKKCEFCFDVTAMGEHRYTDACDGDCNDCGLTREPPHSYADACDGDCDGCGATREAPHAYEDDEDTTCDACGNERELYVLGDANGDKSVSFADIQRIYQHLSTSNKLTGVGLKAADANKDGSVSFSDIQRIYQHLSTANKLF